MGEECVMEIERKGDGVKERTERGAGCVFNLMDLISRRDDMFIENE